MDKDIVYLLKENKIKLTGERRAIISVLEQTKIPLSPANLFLRIKTSLPKANLTTVYRNLEMLEGLGLVKRLGFNKSYFSYELVGEREHHHHIICQRCGKVEELEGISENFVREVSKQTKFIVEDHNLEFFGLCKECQ
jgi:Fur family ferric uptake transcriptional regulator